MNCGAQWVEIEQIILGPHSSLLHMTITMLPLFTTVKWPSPGSQTKSGKLRLPSPTSSDCRCLVNLALASWPIVTFNPILLQSMGTPHRVWQLVGPIPYRVALSLLHSPSKWQPR